jgi:hypothetical protein
LTCIGVHSCSAEKEICKFRPMRAVIREGPGAGMASARVSSDPALSSADHESESNAAACHGCCMLWRSRNGEWEAATPGAAVVISQPPVPRAPIRRYRRTRYIVGRHCSRLQRSKSCPSAGENARIRRPRSAARPSCRNRRWHWRSLRPTARPRPGRALRHNGPRYWRSQPARV